MNGMPSENVDELDRRLKVIEQWIADIQVEPTAKEPERAEPKPIEVWVDNADESVRIFKESDND